MPRGYHVLRHPEPSRPSRARLVIAAGETRSNGDIFLYDVHDDQLVVVSRDPVDESAPAWSRDGRLAWLALPEGGESSVRVASVDALGTSLALPGSGLAPDAEFQRESCH